MNKQQVNVTGNGFQVGEDPNWTNFKQVQTAGEAAITKGKSNKAGITLQDIYDQQVYIIAMLKAKGYDQP